MDSEVDPRFGRASYIVIVDADTLSLEALDNSSNVNFLETGWARGMQEGFFPASLGLF